MPALMNLAGKKFGRLTVTERAPNKGGRTQWYCRCSCGSEIAVSTSNLRGGGSSSCGCLRKERTAEVNTKHGMRHLPESAIWSGMKTRCNNKNREAYKGYGGRGITVCKRWDKFENFYADMGARPSSKHSLERVDNDKGYSPENCIWATPTEQARNQRVRCTNKYGITGVSKRKKWYAYISCNGKQIVLGWFDTLFDAACARKSAELRYWK